MKKILASVLCVALVVLSFAACTSRRYDPNKALTKQTEIPVTAPQQEEIEIPEEEKVYTVENIFGTAVPSVKITGYTGEEENLVIPEKLTHPSYEEKCVVVEIGDAAFQGNETLKTVELPKSVTTIGNGAFQSCVNLTKVSIYGGETIPGGTTLEDGTVVDTVIPANLTKIGDNAFHNTALAEINIPDTVTSIGFHAFSDKFNETPWYASLTDEKVIVGDGILLKCTYSNVVDEAEEQTEVAPEAEAAPETEAEGEAAEGTEEVVEAPEQKKEEAEIEYVEYDLTDVKRIAYYALDNPGAVALKLNENLEEIDKNAIFLPAGTKNNVKFLVPYVMGGSKTESILKSGLYEYDILNAPENPFKWTFDDAASVETWNGGSGLDVSYSADGSLYGRSTNDDPIFVTTDYLNIPTEVFDKLVIRMKHNIAEEKTDVNTAKFHIQVFFRNSKTNFDESASVKVENIEQTSNGEYVEYTLNMAANTAWTGVINAFRIDVGSCPDSDFWLDSVEFTAKDPEFDFGTLLKPVTPAVSEPENPFKYKFAQEELANAWTTSGMTYAYDSEDEAIHGVVTEDAEPTVVSPALEIPGFEYRKLIVRMKHNFAPVVEEAATEEAPAEETPAEEVAEPKTYQMKVYFDNGEGYTEERSKVVEVAETSGDSNVEYEFDMHELDGWYSTVKGIKIVFLGGMNGEFRIDKIEFVPEEKLTRADLINKLYVADGSKDVIGNSAFKDVVVYDDYCNAVIWASQNGLIDVDSYVPVASIIPGEPDLKFYMPDELIKAEEAINLLNAFATLKKAEYVVAAPEDAEAVVYEMDADNTVAAIMAVAPYEAPAEQSAPAPYKPTNTPVEKQPEQAQAEEAGIPLGLIIGIAGGAVVLIAAVIIVIVVLKKKKGAKK